MDRGEVLVDVYENVEMKWKSVYILVEAVSQNRSRSWTGDHDLNVPIRSEVRQYELSFHKKHKDIVLNSYLPYILLTAKMIMEENKTINLHAVVYGRWDMNDNKLKTPYDIIIFTTNHKERLDPALLRPGRMDTHIHMSYCNASVFKQLAFNYWGVCDRSKSWGEEVNVTPAEVAGELMKTSNEEAAFQGLLEFLHRKIHPYMKPKN